MMRSLKVLFAVLMLLLGFIAISFAETIPQYSDYSAVIMCKKKQSYALQFIGDQPPAAMRAHLQAVAEQEPNFAGHYILTSWDCGVACQKLAIIDDETGKVYVPVLADKVAGNYLLDWSLETPRADSKLLVVNLQLTTTPQTKRAALKENLRNVKAYFVWKDNQLVRLQ